MNRHQINAFSAGLNGRIERCGGMCVMFLHALIAGDDLDFSSVNPINVDLVGEGKSYYCGGEKVRQRWDTSLGWSI